MGDINNFLYYIGMVLLLKPPSFNLLLRSIALLDGVLQFTAFFACGVLFDFVAWLQSFLILLLACDLFFSFLFHQVLCNFSFSSIVNIKLFFWQHQAKLILYNGTLGWLVIQLSQVLPSPCDRCVITGYVGSFYVIGLD